MNKYLREFLYHWKQMFLIIFVSALIGFIILLKIYG